MGRLVLVCAFACAAAAAAGAAAAAAAAAAVLSTRGRQPQPRCRPSAVHLHVDSPDKLTSLPTHLVWVVGEPQKVRQALERETLQAALGARGQGVGADHLRPAMGSEWLNMNHMQW